MDEQVPKEQVVDRKPQEARERKPSEVKSGKGKKVLWIVLTLVVIAGLGFGGYYLLKEPKFENEGVANNSGLSTPSYEKPTDFPTPTQELINRDGVSIQILNGTGIEGEASYLQGKLRNLGYEDIEVGNARKQENIETQASFSDDLSSSIVSELTEALKSVYEDINFDTSSSVEYDIEILTGLRSGQTLPTPQPTEAEEPSPTASPSATPTT
jgi:hypothetical protein